MDSDSTGVAANVVNQLLSMIDGVESLNNVLLIAMTNRKDLIDPAILRPGRFEIQIEINLPDEHGRLQILNIHTKRMRENKILGPDVDLAKIAAITKNYTGAELESIVKSAKSFSLNRHHNLLDFSQDLKFTEKTLSVEMQDFMAATEEVKPDFGMDENKIETRLRGSIIDYGNSFTSLMTNLFDSLTGFSQSPDMQVKSNHLVIISLALWTKWVRQNHNCL